MSTERTERTLPTYEVELPSGARVVMRAWSLGYNLAAADSAGNDARQMMDLLDHCLDQIVDPGPYHLDKDGRLDWTEVLACDWDVALLAAGIAARGPILNVRERCPMRRARKTKNGKKSRKKTRCTGYLVGVDADPRDDQIGIDLEDVLRNDVFDVPDVTRAAVATGENRFEVTWGDHRLSFRVPTGQTVLDMVRGHQDPKWGASDDSRAAWNLACRIVDLDGITSRREIAEALLSDRYGIDLAAVVEQLDEWTGEVVNRVEVRCSRPDCGWTPSGDGTIAIPFWLRPEFWTAEVVLANKPTRRRRGGPSATPSTSDTST